MTAEAMPSVSVLVLTDSQLHDLLTEASARGAERAITSVRHERVLKVSEVAGRLACAPSTVYGLIDRNELAAVRLGSAVRVLESALDDWIRARSQRP